MTQATVRRAGSEDLDQIVEVFLACWWESYATVLPDHLVESMTEEAARVLWTRVVAESAPGDLLVAVGGEPERVIGVTRLGPVVDGTGHVASLYVWPRAQGLGVGRLLLEEAASLMVRSGASSATLWVFLLNAPSITFYRHLGWTPDGHHRTQPEFGEPEVRMSRSLRTADVASDQPAGRPIGSR
jgi:GNAT superfamily N-acetyltransferase